MYYPPRKYNTKGIAMTVMYARTPTYVPPRSERRMVVRATEVPDICILQAQAVIVTENNWHIMARRPFHISFDKHAIGIPDELKAHVPVIDVSLLGEECDALVAEAVATCADAVTGRFDIPALIDGLTKLGAKATLPAMKQKENA